MQSYPALLVLLVGVGFIAVTSDLLPAIGRQIVGATLAPLAVPFAVLLGAAFTARRRNSRPIPEGTTADLAGLTPLVVAAGYEAFFAPEATPSRSSSPSSCCPARARRSSGPNSAAAAAEGHTNRRSDLKQRDRIRG